MSRSRHLCQPGYETFIAKEAGAPLEKGPGWVLSGAWAQDLAFSHLALLDPVEFKAKTGKRMALDLAAHFRETSKEVRYDGPWPLCFESAGVEGLTQRRKTVEASFREETAQLSRVMRLSAAGRPGMGPASGFFVVLTAFDRAFAGRRAWGGGQRRMADDAQAPSRSYLKVEEAYMILGEAPKAGESVVDLGAAPGGWSYSAARRGASVTAIDNGPLKSGASGHGLIEHRKEDAFTFSPPAPADWLFCDLLEDPSRTLGLVRRWVEADWCRKFVANLKFGRNDPLPLLREALSSRGGLAPKCPFLKARHLYHDREELTLVGRVG
ncbi:MAG: SAM-dependent methyltransferase [Elusimicrobiota bacterium]|jgi:23S rRNA (cytidine2498-2'-O)-methyltransferase